MIVVDAGAFVEVLLDSRAGREVQARMVLEAAATPDLFDAEVLHRLLVLEKQGYVDASRVDVHIRQLRGARLRRLRQRPLLQLARRYGSALSGYDALYVATAATLGATLITADARLARTATGQFRVPVTTVPTSGR